ERVDDRGVGREIEIMDAMFHRERSDWHRRRPERPRAIHHGAAPVQEGFKLVAAFDIGRADFSTAQLPSRDLQLCAIAAAQNRYKTAVAQFARDQLRGMPRSAIDCDLLRHPFSSTQAETKLAILPVLAKSPIAPA